MYTIRPDKPVNPVLLEILATVQAITKKLGCDYLLVGATARDMLMTHVFGLDARRTTWTLPSRSKAGTSSRP